jgi:hypothetical protein
VFESSGLLGCYTALWGEWPLAIRITAVFLFKGSAVQVEYPVLIKPEKYRPYGNMQSAYLQLYRSVLYRMFQEE